MGAGESASERAATTGGTDRTMEVEHRLTSMLAGLASREYGTIVEPSPRPCGVDLVSVGRAGVFVIDAHLASAPERQEGPDVVHGGTGGVARLRLLLERAAAVRGVLEAGGSTVTPVWPVSVSMADAGSLEPHRVGDAYVVAWDALVDLVGRAPSMLDGTWVDWTHATLLPTSCRSGRSEDEAEARPPDEAVVFLTPWSAGGARRYYARDEQGTSGGYLDLRSGAVADETPRAARVLRQVLPHFLGDLASVGLSAQDERGIRRFLTAHDALAAPQRAVPLVIGAYTAARGRRRLQVRRLTGKGSMEDLGWYDLDLQRTHSDGGYEPEVRYCGQRYLMTDGHP